MTNWSPSAWAIMASLACRACSAGPTSDRRVLRRLPRTRVARRAAVDAVADGVGHGRVQHVVVDAVVERVTADVAGRLQPAGEGEVIGGAGERRGQQPALDLGRQGE